MSEVWENNYTLLVKIRDAVLIQIQDLEPL